MRSTVAVLVGLTLISTPQLSKSQSSLQELTIAPSMYKVALCVDDLFGALPLEVLAPRIPLGCNSIDCCPDCGYRPDIDVSIEFSSEIQGESVIEFSNLEAGDTESLSISGGELIGSTLEFTDRVVIEGVPRKLAASPIAINPRITLSPFENSDNVTQRDVDNWNAMTLSVLQSVNDFPISLQLYEYEYMVCAPDTVFPPADSDELKLFSNMFDDESAIVLDARTGTECLDGHRTDAADSANYPNLLAPDGTCRQEIAVFSEGDAAMLLADEDHAAWLSWTDSPGDVQDVSLDIDPWEVPIRVWIAAPETTADVYLLNAQLSSLLPVPLVFDANNTPDKLLVRAQDEVDEANYLFDANKSGIDVGDDVEFEIVRHFGGMVGVYTAGLSLWTDCYMAIDALQTYKDFMVDVLGFPPIHEEGAINVYYIATAWVAGGASSITGAECPNGLIVVGSGASETTLAHEFGHAFSLRHVDLPGNMYDCNADGAHDFGVNNIMWPGGIDREEFTIGQDWHMSINASSILNWPGLSNTRTGPTRVCGDGSGNTICACYGVR